MPSGMPKTFVIGAISTIVILIIIYILTQLPSGGESGTKQVSVNLADKCSTCHKRVSPDIVNQFARSTMARSGV
jgi:hypothetical protein